jgi:hypothetical protein
LEQRGLGYPEPLGQVVRRFRGLLQHLIQGLGVYGSLLEGLVHPLHDAGDLGIVSAGGFHQLRQVGREADGLIHREHLRAGLHKVRDHVRHIRVGGLDCIGGIEDALLGLLHIAKALHGVIDLIVNGVKFFDQGVHICEAEADADGAK